jgi:hypothetical protein
LHGDSLHKSETTDNAGQTERILPGKDWQHLYEKKIRYTNFSADQGQCKEANASGTFTVQGLSTMASGIYHSKSGISGDVDGKSDIYARYAGVIGKMPMADSIQDNNHIGNFTKSNLADGGGKLSEIGNTEGEVGELLIKDCDGSSGHHS